MFSNFTSNVDIANLVHHQKIESHFQPIISVRRKSIIGVEALSRGIWDENTLVAPLELFAAAQAQNLSFELDSLCREIALQAFLPIHRTNPNVILFLNLHASAFDKGARSMFDLVQKIGIDSRNVAVEILESQFDDTLSLRNSVNDYKNCGFLVAMDDIGVGHSNFDRIVNIKPDILKADSSLIRDIHLEYHKQEIFKSLVHLSEKIGGWIISEGVETEDEAVAALGLGGDIIQGFYFAKPDKIGNSEIVFERESLENVGARFKKQMVAKIKTDYEQRQMRAAIISDAAKRLSRVIPQEFESEMRRFVPEFSLVESACILTEAGVQQSETIVGTQKMHPEKTIIFQPPPRGTDHSLKEYFYALREARVNFFETNPYVPLPCGDLCITASTFFKDLNGSPFILCLHLNAQAAEALS